MFSFDNQKTKLRYHKVEDAHNDDDQKPADTIHSLLALARPERHLLLYSAVCMAVGSAVSLAIPHAAGRIIDLSLQSEEEQSTDSSPFRLLVNLLAIMTLASLSGFFRQIWQAAAGHAVVARLRRRLYQAVLSQDATFFDSTAAGDVLSRLSSDADLVQSAVTDRLLDVARNVLLAVGAVGLLVYTSAGLACVAISILPPMAIGARLVGRRIKDRQARVRARHAEATCRAEQALTCIRTVQQFAAEQWEADHYTAASDAAHVEAIQNAKLAALFGTVLQLVVNLALLGVLGYGGWLVQQGSLTAGDLASFVMYSLLMGRNVSNISTQYMDIMKAVAAANRVFQIIHHEPSIPKPRIVVANNLLERVPQQPQEPLTADITDDEQKALVHMMEMGHLPAAAGGRHDLSTPEHIDPLSVQFQNVTFSYPTRPKFKVLKGLNLSIPAGQVVALVGGSGAGKSTIASLLTRLYDPQSGTITLGGHGSIQDMEPQELRRKIGIVMQEPLLFPTTIEENIRYGSPNATDEQVHEAARLAYVLEFADQFTNGLQTIVGPRGTQLSGGQKQRVAVARCILKNPPIVLFDEATSALDAESEAQVQKAIDTACKDRTVIMIAHRLSTIRNANAIAVLVDGRVDEMGSFEELMGNGSSKTPPSKGRVFRQLMEKQLLLK